MRVKMDSPAHQAQRQSEWESRQQTAVAQTVIPVEIARDLPLARARHRVLPIHVRSRCTEQQTSMTTRISRRGSVPGTLENQRSQTANSCASVCKPSIEPTGKYCRRVVDFEQCSLAATHRHALSLAQLRHFSGHSGLRGRIELQARTSECKPRRVGMPLRRLVRIRSCRSWGPFVSGRP